VEEEVEQACDGFRVPPLLLQPLVENAVRHGVATLSDGAFIRISSGCSSGRLRLAVENNFDPDAPPRRSGGVGLKNVRERLKARHGAEARLDVIRRETRSALRWSCRLTPRRFRNDPHRDSR